MQFSEKLLLFRHSPEQGNPRNPETSFVVTESLQGLDSAIYNQLKLETKDTGISMPVGSTVEYSLPGGATESFTKQSGNLIEKGAPGYFITDPPGIRFVIDDNFVGDVWTVIRGRKSKIKSTSIQQSSEQNVIDEKQNKSSSIVDTELHRKLDESTDPFTDDIVQDSEEPDEIEGARESEIQDSKEKLEDLQLQIDIQSAVDALSNPDLYWKLSSSTRSFLKLYRDYGSQFDSNKKLIAQLVQSAELKNTLNPELDVLEYTKYEKRLDRLSKRLSFEMVQKMIGPDQIQEEYNEYVVEHNKRKRSNPYASLQHVAGDIYDRRYIQSPRGKFSETNGRVPTMRSRYTSILEGYRAKMKEVYARIATVPEADAEAVCKEFRAYENSYKVTKMYILDYFEQQFSEVSDLTMTDRRHPNASYQDKVVAYFKRHRYTDTLMSPRFSTYEAQPNRSLREVTQQRLQKYAPESPRRY